MVSFAFAASLCLNVPTGAGASTISTSPSPDRLITESTTLAAARKYFRLESMTYTGRYKYYSVTDNGVQYRGYLTSDGSHMGGIYIYYGYLYPYPDPYPVPAVIRPELLEE